MLPRRDLVGQRFGRLLVKDFAGLASGKNAKWLCQCDCGTQKTILGQSLVSGRTHSCGCFQKECLQNNPRILHGHARNGRSAEYAAYQNAKDRCRNPNRKTYSYYGGRGIEFRFDSFEQFFSIVGSRPTPAHSLDRKNPDGHYEPSNVKWSTKKEQGSNQRHHNTAWFFAVHFSD